jgi:hypothetical protein
MYIILRVHKYNNNNCICVLPSTIKIGALFDRLSVEGEGTVCVGEIGAMSTSSTPTPSPPPAAASSAGEVASATRS